MFFFFCGGWNSNHEPYIYYALSLPIELCSRGPKNVIIYNIIRTFSIFYLKKIYELNMNILFLTLKNSYLIYILLKNFIFFGEIFIIL